MSWASVVSSVAPADLKAIVSTALPEGQFKNIFIKPNWVLHESDARFPASALVTSTGLIDAIVAACLDRYPGVESITVGDVPLQSCDWELLRSQAGIDLLEHRYASKDGPDVRFLDLRREYWRVEEGFLEAAPHTPGDPLGYREVELDASSYLEEVTSQRTQFRVADYDAEATRNAHRPGSHKYLISGSALRADLFINAPKLKTHQKAGITGALKNLVGVTAAKSCLVHYRSGRLGKGGDEFPDDVHPLIVLQSGLREFAQKRSRMGFSQLRKGWQVARRFAGIETEGTRENLTRTFYTAGGAWHGNDTIWRMIYDLNRIIRWATADGKLKTDGGPQRAYVTICDGLVAGEGNGPLQPLAVDLGVVILSNDPFLADMAAAQVMGLSWRRIPTTSHHRKFAVHGWGDFEPTEVELEMDGSRKKGIDEITVLREFLAAPGWSGHVELEGRRVG